MPARTLNAAEIVREAVLAADEWGVEWLTMRRLGRRLGVQAMALYRHVGGRELLLDAMVAAMMAELSRTMTPRTHSSTTGQVYLQDTAHDVRDLALTHPWLIRLMVVRPAQTVGLNRPLCSLACTEAFLQALDHRGFDPVVSVRTYHHFTAFLLGHLVIEAGAPEDTSTSDASPEPARSAGLRRRSIPDGLLKLLAVNDYPAEFELSLRGFLHAFDPRPDHHEDPAEPSRTTPDPRH